MAKRTWSGPLAFEKVDTGDERAFTDGALTWSTPIPLKKSHEEETVIGAIATIERQDDGTVYGTGTFLDSEAGRAAVAECEARAAEGLPVTVSVDLDTVSMELRVRKDVYEKEMAVMEALLNDEEPPAPEEPEVDEEGRVTVASNNNGDFVTVFTSANIRAASLATISAFSNAAITLGWMPGEAEGENTPPDEAMAAEMAVLEAEVAESLVAGAYPVAPPASFFENPGFTAATPIQIDDDGHIYGHAATWNSFHLSFGGKKVKAPRSKANYSYYRVGAIRTEEGTDIPIGKITMSGGHASGDLSPFDTMAHYDNSAAVVADVVCGEDSHGLWVSGALRPDVTPEQVRELRAAPLSGDWREIRGNLELVAVLAVSVPGFVVPRMSAMTAGGADDRVLSLTASASFEAVESCNASTCGCQPSELNLEDQVALKALLAERDAMRDETQAEATAETLSVSCEESGTAVTETLSSSQEDVEGERMTELQAGFARLERIESAKRQLRVQAAKASLKKRKA